MVWGPQKKFEHLKDTAQRSNGCTTLDVGEGHIAEILYNTRQHERPYWREISAGGTQSIAAVGTLTNGVVWSFNLQAAAPADAPMFIWVVEGEKGSTYPCR